MVAGCVIVTMCPTSAGAPRGWNSKATASEKAASTAVGGFNKNGRRLYHQGLEHLYHTHQPIGRFTIRQVVEQERAREAVRARLRSGSSTGNKQVSGATGENGAGTAGFIILILLVLGGMVVLAAARSRSMLYSETGEPFPL